MYIQDTGKRHVSYKRKSLEIKGTIRLRRRTAHLLAADRDSPSTIVLIQKTKSRNDFVNMHKFSPQGLGEGLWEPFRNYQSYRGTSGLAVTGMCKLKTM